MVPLLLLAGVFAALSTGMKLPSNECCESKDVGGVGYTLVGRMNTEGYNCLNDCIYVQVEEPSVKFCFAIGDLEVECTEDETYEGTRRPPMEGSERPPMEGSEMPPMEGSEMPSVEGTERPPMPPMEGSEMPPMEGSEMPPMEGSEMPPMEGSEMPPMEGTERPPMEGSEMPPMEGSERPPMEGSEMPPMEGSERPPMEGSEMPPMEGTVQPEDTTSSIQYPEYTRDGSYGYIPPGLVPTLNRLGTALKMEIPVTCCDKGITEYCGNGTECKGICGSENDQAIVITSNYTSTDWCDLTCSTGSSEIETALVPGVISEIGTCFWPGNLPIWALNWCVHFVQDVVQIPSYPICCLHPYVYCAVDGVGDWCCDNHQLCYQDAWICLQINNG